MSHGCFRLFHRESDYNTNGLTVQVLRLPLPTWLVGRETILVNLDLSMMGHFPTIWQLATQS